MTWHRAIREVEIPLGKTKPVRLGEDIVLICRTHSGRILAVEDRCSHDGASFEDGELSEEDVLTCPRHGARFNVTTGAALSMPAVAPVETFDLRRTDDGWIEVDVEDE
jgi:3-phenylpropionate/trans-cinnamate dioxygenase ferredoxin subunit